MRPGDQVRPAPIFLENRADAYSCVGSARVDVSRGAMASTEIIGLVSGPGYAGKYLLQLSSFSCSFSLFFSSLDFLLPTSENRFSSAALVKKSAGKPGLYLQELKNT